MESFDGSSLWLAPLSQPLGQGGLLSLNLPGTETEFFHNNYHQTALPQGTSWEIDLLEEDNPFAQQKKDEDENDFFNFSSPLLNQQIPLADGGINFNDENPSNNQIDSLTNNLAVSSIVSTTVLEYKQDQLNLQIWSDGVKVEEIEGQHNQPLPELERIKVEAIDRVDRSLPAEDTTFLDSSDGIGIRDGDDVYFNEDRIEGDEALRIVIQPTETYNSSSTALIKLDKINLNKKVKITALQGDIVVDEQVFTADTETAEISFSSVLPFDTLHLEAADENTEFTFRSVSFEATQAVLDAPPNPPSPYIPVRLAQYWSNLLVFEDGVLVEQAEGTEDETIGGEFERLSIQPQDSFDIQQEVDKIFFNKWRGFGITDGDDGNSNLRKKIDGDEVLAISLKPTPLYEKAQEAIVEVDRVNSIANYWDEGGTIKIAASLDGEIVAETIYEVNQERSSLNFVSEEAFDTLLLSAGDDDTGFNVRLVDLQAINLEAVQPPLAIAVSLANDTGSDATDGITNDATMVGLLTGNDEVSQLYGGFDEDNLIEISEQVNPDGSFTLTPSLLAILNGEALSDGDYTFYLQAVDSNGQVSQVLSVSFKLDTGIPILDIITPIGDADHSFTSRLIGSVSDNSNNGLLEDNLTVEYSLNSSPPITASLDEEGEFNEALPLDNLSIGTHNLTITATDTAGNTQTIPIDFNISDDFLVGPDGSDGWGVKNISTLPTDNNFNGTTEDNLIILGEENSFLTSTTLPIELGQTQGSRTLTFDVEAFVDIRDNNKIIEDQLLVYLVDANNPSQTLLDGGSNGTPLFSLAGEKAEFMAGQVSYNSQTVEVDLTSLAQETDGLLVFQLLNHDGDTLTYFKINNFTNTVDDDGQLNPTLNNSPTIQQVGASLDLTTLTVNPDLELIVDNLYLKDEGGRMNDEGDSGDSGEGGEGDSNEYRAILRIKNEGEAIGRNVAVVLEGLDESLTIETVSGFDNQGNPYVNLTPTIPNGGLDSGAYSGAIEIVIPNPNLLPINFTAKVLSGGVNVAPIIQPLPIQTVMPGDRLEIPLTATDANGDRVTFTLDTNNPLPTGELTGNNTLIFTPTPNQIGTYTFNLIASDGVAQASQEVTVEVVEDTITTTRISGQVLDTLGNPLVNVPIELGRLVTATDSEGNFTLEVPPSLIPTENLDITIPNGDIYFDPFSTGEETIEFHRAGFDNATGTDINNPRRHPNLVSGFLDASMVYGSNEERANALRTLDGTGKLKTSPGELLPLNTTDYFPTGFLENENSGGVPGQQFVAGDVRASENVALASLHTILLREHNRLAEAITVENPAFTGEEIYQQARKIVGAMVQRITYNEYLPLILGENTLPDYSGYNPNLEPTPSTLFATAAFRIGHSQSVPQLWLVDENGTQTDSLNLREAFFTSTPVINEGVESILRGLVAQKAQELDVKVIDELRNFLFGPPGAGGMDLAAINIQRGRDLGLPDYNSARVAMGLTPVTDFSEITSDVALQQALASTYTSVDNIDVWVGGLAEDKANGAMVGSLFQAILVEQFVRSREGDLFWYENGQLSHEDLILVNNTTLATLIERNSNIINLEDNVFNPQQQVNNTSSGVSGNSSDQRSFDGGNNNQTNLNWGQAGTNLRIEADNGYGDLISTPGGGDRLSAREISNQLFAQSTSLPDSTGATAMLVFWGQLVSHDLTLTPTGITNTLEIHGDDLTGNQVYPFVAEKLPLLLEHDVYERVNNIITRPIYLPALDVDNGVTINPNAETIVTTANIPGAAVTVAAGSLEDGEGNLFEGVLSITEVPRDLTPAALPRNLVPDLVVTIQPGEMVFTQPAPLSLPNNAGYNPDTQMDLWSINPVTGEFEVVGLGQVSNDGAVIETIEGGIRNSSWHFFMPIFLTPLELLTRPFEFRGQRPNPLGRNTSNLNSKCLACLATQNVTSEVELHSGGLRETHELVSYNSLNAARGLTLTYDSLRADVQPIVHFDFEDAVTQELSYIVAQLSFNRGNFQYQIPGATPQYGLDGGEHFWRIPEEIENNHLDASLQADFSNQPSGLYEYNLNVGILQLSENDSIFTGSLTDNNGELMVVNSIDSPFGSGWGISGWQELVENPNGSVLLIDGDGSEMLFELNSNNGYDSPPGDFSTLVRLPDSTFRRTLKDQTVYQFNNYNHIESITDAVGNVTTYNYDAGQRLIEIIDPVGLITSLSYTGEKVTAITDPAGRITYLEYDNAGNLIKVTDPDLSSRTWEYDSSHRMKAEIDQRGFREETVYNFAGRVIGATSKDGSTIQVTPLQTKGLYPASLTSDADTAPFVVAMEENANTSYADGNGKIIAQTLDQAGQEISSRDGSGGAGDIRRNEENLITRRTDARGFNTEYIYDERGNVIDVVDDFASSGGNLAGNLELSDLDGSNGFVINGANFNDQIGSSVSSAGDINGDGLDDLIIGVANADANGSNSGAGYVVFGNNSGTTSSFNLSDLDGNNGFVINGANSNDLFGSSVSNAGDINGDGIDDLIIGAPNVDVNGSNSGASYVIFGSNSGTTSTLELSSLNGSNGFVINGANSNDLFGSSVSNAGDINGDGIDDLIIGAYGADPNGSFSGASYVIFGSNLGWNASLELADLDGSNGFAINGVNSFDFSGTSVSGAGDFNGDGIDDLIIGAPDAKIAPFFLNERPGRSYVVFGSNLGWNTSFELSDLDGDNGFAIDGISNLDYLGHTVSRAGDINDDGIDDVIIGAPGSNNGTSYVIFGSDTGWDALNPFIFSLKVSDLDGSNGFAIVGDNFSRESGFSVSNAGDVNKDNIDDVIIGAPDSSFSNVNSTASYVVFGSNSEFPAILDSLTLDGSNGFVVNSGDNYDESGTSVSNAGDVNGDGIEDFIIGAPNTDSNGINRTGVSYVVFGLLPVSLQYTYDPVFNLPTSYTDDLGRQTLYEIDPANGNLLSTTQVVGEVGGGDDAITTYTYTDSNLVDLMIDANGRIMDNDYDSLGRLIKVTYAVGTPESASIQYEYDLAGNQTAMIDESGNRTEYEYDGRNRLIRTTYAVGTPEEATSTMEYDGNGNLVAMVDGNNNRTEYEYDAKNRLIKTIEADPDGNGPLISPVSTNVYDNNGNLISTVDPLGRETRYIYDNRDRLVKTILPDGTINESLYDLDNNLIGSIDATGDVSNQVYDSRSRLINETDALGNVTNYEYDVANQLVATIDANGNRTEYEYDELGRQVAVIDALGNVTRTEYDLVGNVTATIDANGNRTEYEYDERDRQILVRDAENGTTITTYDAVGNVLSTTDELGRITQFTYDARHRQTALTDPLNYTTTYVYDKVNNLIQVTDANNHSINYAYDGLNRLVATTNAKGDSQVHSYNAIDNLIATTDELGRTTTYTYDIRNRQIAIIDPLGHITTTEYDDEDNVIATVDGNGNRTEYEYDELNRQVKVIDANNQITSYEYDGVGNLLSITDPEQNVTSYIYDQLNRLITETNQLGDARTYEYDGVGNLIETVDRNGRVKTYNYDQLNRNTSEVWLDENNNPIHTINSSYDAASQLIGVNDVHSAYSYTYDLNGRLIELDNAGTPGVPNVVFNYSYDGVGNLLSVTDTIDNVVSGVETFTYDELNRVITITQSGNGVSEKRVDFTYDAASQGTGINRYRDLAGTELIAESTHTYDDFGRLIELIHESATAILANYSWTYDEANRITSFTSPDGVANYDYDNLDQVVGAQYDYQDDESYSYDDNGNRTNAGYITGANNQLLSDGVYNYEYDAEGNRIKKTEIANGEITAYEWDYRNRLTRVVIRDSNGNVISTSEYTYDVFNRRIAKSVDSDGDGSQEAVVERYVLDGEEVALVFDGDGNLEERFLHGTQIDEVIAQENVGGEVYWALTDNLGSIRYVIDNDGNIVNEITYNSFGEITGETNPDVDFRFSYTGREFDEETGEYYYRARYYDATVGRFISVDPLGFEAGDSNFYRYVGNNPLLYTDPSGLIALSLIIIPATIALGALWLTYQINQNNNSQSFSNNFSLNQPAYLYPNNNSSQNQLFPWTNPNNNSQNQFFPFPNLQNNSQNQFFPFPNPQNKQSQVSGFLNLDPCLNLFPSLLQSSSDIPEKPLGKVTKLKEKWLEKKGVDPHELKDGNVPGKISEYDIYKDQEDNLWGVRKGQNPKDSDIYLDNLQNY